MYRLKDHVTVRDLRNISISTLTALWLIDTRDKGEEVDFRDHPHDPEKVYVHDDRGNRRCWVLRSMVELIGSDTHDASAWM